MYSIELDWSVVFPLAQGMEEKSEKYYFNKLLGTGQNIWKRK